VGVQLGYTHLLRPLNQDGGTELISVGYHVHMTGSTAHKHFIQHMDKITYSYTKLSGQFGLTVKKWKCELQSQVQFPNIFSLTVSYCS